MPDYKAPYGITCPEGHTASYRNRKVQEELIINPEAQWSKGQNGEPIKQKE
jgi:hypothetical protein